MDTPNLRQLGCVLEPPDERDYDYEIISGGTTELPKNFIIPNVPHFYQNGIDACVGMAVAAAKSVQEGVKLSPRYAWHLAKKRDGYYGWGTTITKAITGMIEEGALLYNAIDESVEGVNRETYMKPDITIGMQAVASTYKAASYWRAGHGAKDITALKVALYEQEIPLITSNTWKKEYNKPVKGYLPKPTSDYGEGHSFIFKGWRTEKDDRETLVFGNSFRESWGDKGDFYIFSDELKEYGMGSFFVLTDIENEKARVLARYNGKLVRNAKNPAHYYVGAGQIAWIKNEQSFHFGTNNKFWGRFADTIVIEEDLTKLYDFVF